MTLEKKKIRVAIVEDEPFVALDIELSLEDAGFEVISKCTSLKDALIEARTSKADIFTLDYDLGGPNSTAVAAILKERGIPFVVITGQTELVKSLDVFDGAPKMRKPFRHVDIIKKIKQAALKPLAT